MAILSTSVTVKLVQLTAIVQKIHIKSVLGSFTSKSDSFFSVNELYEDKIQLYYLGIGKKCNSRNSKNY